MKQYNFKARRIGEGVWFEAEAENLRTARKKASSWVKNNYGNLKYWSIEYDV